MIKNREELIEYNRLTKDFHFLQHRLAVLEFIIRGFDESLKELGLGYEIYERTPLHKSKTVGIPKKDYDKKSKENKLFIIAVMNPKEVDKHIYYVYDQTKYLHFKSGKQSNMEYLNYCMVVNDKKEYLPTIEEYIHDKKHLQTI